LKKENHLDTKILHQAVLDNAGYAIIVCDTNGIIILFNHASEQLLGYQSSEIVGKQTPAIFHFAEEVKERAQEFSQAFDVDINPGFEVFIIKSKLGLPNKHEWTYVHKNGQHLTVLLNVTSLFDQENNLIGYMGVAADIREQKLTESLLLDSHEKLKEAQRIARVGSWTLDLENNHLEWSDEIFNLFEINKGEFDASYEAFLEAIHPDDRDLVNQAYQHSLATKQPYEIKHRLLFADGRIKHVNEACETLFDNNGQAVLSRGTVQDITQITLAEEQIKQLARYDSLTGLFNRFSLENMLSQAISLAEKNKNQLAIMFIDMDRFKVINDNLGHHIGDELLKEVANRLNLSIDEGDFVARLGGDEFVVVLSTINNPLDVARKAAEIIEKLGTTYHIDVNELNSTPSIGISLYPENGHDGQSLMKHADIAMYHAKELGRNRFQFFTENLNIKAFERAKIEADLHIALSENQFQLYYQPKIDLSTGKISSAEALIRWEHPEKGLLSPDKFIPVSEETGLINKIGEWVIHESCRELKEWKAKGILSKIAVNLSPLQLEDESFPERL